MRVFASLKQCEFQGEMSHCGSWKKINSFQRNDTVLWQFYNEKAKYFLQWEFCITFRARNEHLSIIVLSVRHVPSSSVRTEMLKGRGSRYFPRFATLCFSWMHLTICCKGFWGNFFFFFKVDLKMFQKGSRKCYPRDQISVHLGQCVSKNENYIRQIQCC